MAQAWLCTWLDGMADVEVGWGGPIWTLPPRYATTRHILRRRDGYPREPAWGPGHLAVVYDPRSELCVAVLQMIGWPEWSELDEVWYTQTDVLAAEPSGWKLSELRLAPPKQGGRERIADEQIDAVFEAFGLEWSYGVTVLDTVRYRLRPDGPTTTRRIVRAGEPKAEGDISVVSPIARGLLGAHVGEVVRVVLPTGVHQIEVLAVEGPAD
jgi:hypothetical protein